MVPTLVDQVTAVLALPVTVALKAWLALIGKLMEEGLSDRLTAEDLTVKLVGSLMVEPGPGLIALSLATPSMEAGTLPVTVKVVGEM